MGMQCRFHQLMKQSHLFFLGSILFFIVSSCPAQTKNTLPYLNLDFERDGSLNPWIPNLVGYSYDLDSSNPSHGKKSLLIFSSRTDGKIDTSMPASVGIYFPIL